MLELNSILRQRLLAREFLLGTFVKTPAPQIVEILGRSGFDFLIIDQEHASFGRAETDLALLAGRAAPIPCLVRVHSPSAHQILGVLDQGAAGVLVPHIATAQAAREAAAACRYLSGNRGFSSVTRAGDYGADSMTSHTQDSDAAVSMVAQIEDREALEHVEQIVSLPEVDAVFIGAGDLAVSMRAGSVSDPEVGAAVSRIAAAVARAGKPCLAYAGRPEEIERLVALGVSAVVLSSDQQMLRGAAIAATRLARA